MLYPYLKLAFRQLWRNRLYTGLNVLGLAIGLSTCWVIFRIISFEYSFDRNQPNGDRMYRLVSRYNAGGKDVGSPHVPNSLAEVVQGQVAGLELVVPISQHNPFFVLVPSVAGSKPLRLSEVGDSYQTTPAYFKLISYTWLAGDPANALAEPGKVVLTQSRAKLYFPHLTPRQVLGKQLTYIHTADTTHVSVTGVVADLMYLTHFDGKEFVSPREWPVSNAEQWIQEDAMVYVLLQPKVDPSSVIRQINLVAARYLALAYKQFGMGNDQRRHLLQPLDDIHFGADYWPRASRKELLSLAGLALFILALACINYINLSTALVPQRAREIGVRKALGSSRSTLIAQFLGETTLVTCLALLVAWPISVQFVQSFDELVPWVATDRLDPIKIALFLVALVAGVSVLAGLYPSWLITRLQPVKVLRGQRLVVVGATGRITLRKGLVVFQFVIAQVFIVGTIVVGRQLHFAYTRDIGFNREAVVLIEAPMQYIYDEKSPLHNRHLTLCNNVKQLPGVAALSLSTAPMSVGFDGEVGIKGRKYGPIGFLSAEMSRKAIDTAWLDLYGVQLLAGRNLKHSDTPREWIINETALKAFNLGSPQEAIGKVLYEHPSNDPEGKYGTMYPIVGVVKDFDMGGVSRKIKPVALTTETRYVNGLNIKLASANPTDWSGTLAAIRAIWEKAYPNDTFSYRFYDDVLSDMYSEEQTLSRIVNLATVVAILISCLGLFGLVTLTAYQRTKEIGIRKVLGASVASVVALLSQEFVVLVGIAIVIATPLAGWGMKQWLNNYAYQIDLSWWLFAGAAVLALIIALVTVAFQSIRAAIANPVDSLRNE
ncbi:FtsX-like permease family protein [Fibrivirga algicola]|uniref:FtsX-like permease family protein n=1 Tax=Fibrivirga algicola TaxID=2950420 RepID=A0ABX0QDI5_9BACT|nr:FtsX-like permease family protein [Fibrivirga algicola]NID10450.1 FtsX-like permease family protein [Fibrivirga algicola]